MVAYGDDDGQQRGLSSHVFRTSGGGATYGQVAKLTASDAASFDYFGISVAIEGGTVVVGAYHDDDAAGGANVGGGQANGRRRGGYGFDLAAATPSWSVRRWQANPLPPSLSQRKSAQ